MIGSDLLSVERDEVTIYLERLRGDMPATEFTTQWPNASAQVAD